LTAAVFARTGAATLGVTALTAMAAATPIVIARVRKIHSMFVSFNGAQLPVLAQRTQHHQVPELIGAAG
jgi:hypothetical protein